MIPRQTLARMKPYVPGKAIEEVVKEQGLSEVIKMASNENPLGCPISFGALEEALKKVHYYPHPGSSGILEALSEHFGQPVSRFVLGNGSDEVIQLLGLAYVNPGDEVLTSAHTFSEYTFAAHLMDATLVTVPMDAQYGFDLQAMLHAITPKTRLIFIANPNNPTGTMISGDRLTSFLDQVPVHTLVVLDEAYAEYAQSPTFVSGAALIDRYPNLIVLRTFSKLYGLAGFRIGYGLAQENIITQLQKVRPPFNVNSLALAAAPLALQAHDHVADSLRVNQEGLAYFYAALSAMGLEYIASQANFICIFLPIPASQAFEAFLKQGIIIRALTSFGLNNAIRVTVGLPEHNHRFIEALKKIASQ